MVMLTLEKYLKKNRKLGIIDHQIRVTNAVNSRFPIFYIHADSKGSDTLDFMVVGNHLEPMKDGKLYFPEKKEVVNLAIRKDCRKGRQEKR